MNVHCTIYLQTPVAPDGLFFTYKQADEQIITEHPPLIGDLLYATGLGQCKVVGRDWLYPRPGSVCREPMLTLVVVAGLGLFHQEAPDQEDR